MMELWRVRHGLCQPRARSAPHFARTYAFCAARTRNRVGGRRAATPQRGLGMHCAVATTSCKTL